MTLSGLKTALFLSCALIVGCASSEIGSDFNAAAIHDFKKGQTSYAEASSRLGPPSNSQVTAKGNWLHSWGYVRAEAALSQARVTDNKSITLVFGPDEKFLGVIQYRGFVLSDVERARLLATPQPAKQ